MILLTSTSKIGWLLLAVSFAWPVARIDAQPVEVEWEVTQPFPITVKDLIAVEGGGYLSVGYVALISREATEYEGHVVRFGPRGELLWSRVVAVDQADEFLGVAEIPGAGFLAVGATGGNDLCRLGCVASLVPSDVLVTRFDVSGNVEWSRRYGGPSVDVGRDVLRCRRGGFVIAGNTVVDGACDLYLFRIDANGDVVWERSFGGLGEQQGWAAVELDDERLVAVGRSRRPGERSEVYIVVVDAQGVLLEERRLGGFEDMAFSVDRDGVGGVILSGQSQRSGEIDTLLVRLDRDTKVLWERTYSSSDPERPRSHALEVRLTGGGEFIALGKLVLRNSRTELLRVDSSGQPLWRVPVGENTVRERTVGRASFLIESDGGYVVAGNSRRPLELASFFIRKFRFRGFLRGDVTGDARVNISDAVRLLLQLFAGAPPPECRDAADADDDGVLSVSDAIFILNYLFLGGPAPIDPGSTSCGGDPTIDELDCVRHRSCE